MTTDYIDLCCIRSSRSGVPYGYVLPNGVVVIWSNGHTQNNMASRSQAATAFPNLLMMGEEQEKR